MTDQGKQMNRYLAVVQCEGKEHSFVSASPIEVTVVDLGLWDCIGADWFYRIVGNDEAHVTRIGAEFAVRRMSSGMDKEQPGYYDALEKAMCEAEKLVNRLYDALGEKTAAM